MDVKLPSIQNFKKTKKVFADILQKHTLLAWVIIGLILLGYAGYIFYFKIFMPMTISPASTIQLPSIQKERLNQILSDLDNRQKLKSEASGKTFSNPFEFKP